MMINLKSRTYIQISLWIAAACVGGVAVFFAKLIHFIQTHYFHSFYAHPYLITLCAPLFFLLASFFVVKFAPEAKGSGIPQVLEAIKLSEQRNDQAETSPLVSIKTAVVKVISASVGLIGGASIGREGPTVQIASSLFAWFGRRMKIYHPHLDFSSYLIAGGAAGIAAAFNTPLAGITFALEEIAEASFSKFKKPVMISIIIAGISAQAIAGNYLYFGRPVFPNLTSYIIPESLFIGLLCGILGGIFARLLTQKDFKLLPRSWQMRSLTCGLVCAAFILASKGNTAGSGYEVVRHYMDSYDGRLPLFLGPKNSLPRPSPTSQEWQAVFFPPVFLSELALVTRPLNCFLSLT